MVSLRLEGPDRVVETCFYINVFETFEDVAPSGLIVKRYAYRPVMSFTLCTHYTPRTVNLVADSIESGLHYEAERARVPNFGGTYDGGRFTVHAATSEGRDHRGPTSLIDCT